MIVYKVVTNVNGRLYSYMYDPHFASIIAKAIEYVPGEFVKSKIPILSNLYAFKTLEDTASFIPEEDSCLEVWIAEAVVSDLPPLILRNFWYRDTLEDFTLVDAPKGTVSCSEIKLIKKIY